MPMKNTILLILLILLAICIAYFASHTTDQPTEKQNQVATTVATTNSPEAAKATTHSAHINKNTVTYTAKTYEQMSTDEKLGIYTDCLEVFHYTESLSEFIAQYSDQSTLTHEQQQALEKLYRYCDRYRPHAEKLAKHSENNEFYDPKTNFPYFLIELHQIKADAGIDSARKAAEEALFSQYKAHREAASRFLMEDDTWIEMLSESIHMQHYFVQDNRVYISGAIQQRICELNLTDCSPDSPGALRACGYNPAMCGHGTESGYTHFVTPHDREQMDKYLVYFRSRKP